MFQVPPLALLFPNLAEEVEVLPGRKVDAVRTVLWFTGAWLPAAVQTGDDLDASKENRS